MFSLTLYRDSASDNRRPGARTTTGSEAQMKTTMMFRNTANPRRTTLAHLKDADELVPQEQPEHPVTLPNRTANPRRTRLMVAPASQQADQPTQGLVDDEAAR